MPKGRGRRGRPPNFVEWVQGSPLGIMRQAYVRSRNAVTCDHPKLRRIWRIRDASSTKTINTIIFISLKDL